MARGIKSSPNRLVGERVPRAGLGTVDSQRRTGEVASYRRLRVRCAAVAC